MTDTVNTTNQVTETPVEATQATTAPAAVAQPKKDNTDTFAIVGLVISIFNLCAWLLPICGCPMAILGIVFSYMGLKSQKNKTFAMIGLVISILAIIATIINAVIGGAMALNTK